MTGLERFKRDVKKIAKANGIKIRLLKKDAVLSPGDNVPTPGYFCDEPKELSVAINGDEEEWLGVFVHESCHMDQYIQNRFLWEKSYPALHIFSDWIGGKRIVKREILEEAVQDIIRLELDCERRSIEKILKYDLKIDIEAYIQCANLCLYGYLFFFEKKKWCTEVLEHSSVGCLAPKRFKSQYHKIPVKFHKALLKEYNAQYVA